MATGVATRTIPFCKTPEIEARFWAKVNKAGADDCWEWTGAKTSDHGSFRIQLNGESRAVYPHRLIWEWTHGPIPAGMYCCHRCDVRHCVNPAHLFLGTCADNLADMRKKGRGSAPPHGDEKLTPTVVLAIVRLSRAGVKGNRIRDMLGLSSSAVYSVLNGRRWSHLTGIQRKRKGAKNAALPRVPQSLGLLRRMG